MSSDLGEYKENLNDFIACPSITKMSFRAPIFSSTSIHRKV